MGGMVGDGRSMLNLTVAFLGGLLPTYLYVLGVWWLDRYEKEPISLLLLAFFWGAVPAALLSVFVEVLFSIPVGRVLGTESLAADLLTSGVGAPLVEESFKGVALIGFVLFFRMEIDDALDGIIYGAMIGFGFALTENVVSYFLPILTNEGLRAGLTSILLRAILFGGNHALWSGIIGAAIGHARWHPCWQRRILLPAGGWILSVMLHAMHNTGAMLAERTACLSLSVSLVTDWGGLLLLLALAGLVLRKESRWIEVGLGHEVLLGLLSPEEYDLLTSAQKRMWVHWRSLVRGGSEAYRAVGRYYQAATELAFTKHHLQLRGSEADQHGGIPRLRQQLASCRARALPWLWQEHGG